MPTSFVTCRNILVLCPALLFASGAHAEAPAAEIAPAINSLGIDLYREQIKSANGSDVLLSPYSIATTLAMTYAGADGVTKAEMEKVLHLPADQAACGVAFQTLAAQLTKVVKDSERQVAGIRAHDGDATPIQLRVANRLFVQSGYSFRSTFVDELRQYFGSDLAELDFKNDARQARQTINQWAASQTQDEIRDLLPPGQPTIYTRLALVNALYLHAGWADEFRESATQPELFYYTGKKPAPVPTLRAQRGYGYAKRDGYVVVTLLYLGKELQFVLLVPDKKDGLDELEKSLTAKELSDCAHLKRGEVTLHVPKFKIEPDTMALTRALQLLGLQSAFDHPRGTANFDQMAPRKPNDYLYIGAVFHKTWLTLDEHGTEATAATEVRIDTSLGITAPSKELPPVEVRADRPFMFAIQHVKSGACLFLGRVTDPR